jgi:hypothetical protein
VPASTLRLGPVAGLNNSSNFPKLTAAKPVAGRNVNVLSRHHICCGPASGGYLRNSHPQFRTSNERPRSLIVANEPLSLVPNDKARKRLRQSLPVTSDPGSPDHEDSLVVLWRSRYGLPSTTHSFDLFRASMARGDQNSLVTSSHIHPRLALC